MEHASSSYSVNESTSCDTEEKVPTCCRAINVMLDGGFRTTEVTEITGESGSGKTQICLQTILAIQATQSDRVQKWSSIYIHSTNPFLVRRLVQLVNSMWKISPDINPLDLVTTKYVGSPDEFLLTLTWVDQLLSKSFNSKYPCRVVIIDSIAGIFRHHFPIDQLGRKDRTLMLNAVVYGLTKLARKHNVAVIITNEVVDVFSTDKKCEGFFSSFRKVRSSMAIHYSNIHHQMYVARNYNKDGAICCRIFGILMSTSYVEDACTFSIKAEGVV